MRAGKLTTLSAVAVLLGGTGLATNLAGAQTSLQSGTSMQRSSQSKGGVPQKSLGHQKTAQATGQQPSHKRQGIVPGQHRGAFAGATPRELGEASTSTQDRTARLRDAARNIPRVSSVGTDIRIDAVVPRNVRQAAAPLPPEVQRMHPRFRNSRAFKYRDQVVLVNPATSRIVAIVKSPG
jgi:hypothetical protein